MLMSEVNGAGHRAQQSSRPPRVLGIAGNRVGQAPAVDEPHAEVLLPVVFSDLVNRHDVRMVQ
jgi:hypothetical protein